MSPSDVAQALRDLSRLGRLSEESEAWISDLLDPAEEEETATKSTVKSGGSK